MNHVLHGNCDRPLPDHISAGGLANTFNKYFLDKISNLRSKLDGSTTNNINTSTITSSDLSPPQTFTKFTAVAEEDIRKIVQKSNSKSCGLDPIPTSMIKQLIEPLAPVLTKIVNLSLRDGIVPRTLKSATVTPLDQNIMKNYRPISNLSFISKILEKVLSNQLCHHLASNYNLMEPMQSAYRKHHSTETTLLAVQNDLLMAIDQKKAAVLVLLDLTVPFDTIDYNILLQRMNTKYGVRGVAVDWFRSYLSDRTQAVKIKTSFSSASKLLCSWAHVILHVFIFYI